MVRIGFIVVSTLGFILLIAGVGLITVAVILG